MQTVHVLRMSVNCMKKTQTKKTTESKTLYTVDRQPLQSQHALSAHPFMPASTTNWPLGHQKMWLASLLSKVSVQKVGDNMAGRE